MRIRGNRSLKAALAGSLMLGAIAVGTALAAPATVAGAAPPQQTIYSNLTTDATRTLDYDWSASYEATQLSEYGNQVAFAPGTSRTLNNVVVAMSDWACQSGTADGDNCVSAPGATFSQPLTLNLYAVGAGNAPGALIDSVTQTFAIPYRPTGDDVHCPADQYGNPAGLYWDGYHCDYGITSNVTFNLPNITVPDNVIWSVASNTSDYGPNPTHTPGPADSLNIAYSANTDTSVGSDPLPDSAYVNAANSGNGYYCGSGTVGTFSLDNENGTGCTSYDEYSLDFSTPTGRYLVPEAQFNALAPDTVTFTSPNPGPVNVGGPTYTPTAVGGGSTSPVVISLDGASTGCTLNAGVVSFTSVGTCLVDANQAGDANYTAAPQAQQSITVNPALCTPGHYSGTGHVPCSAAPAGTYVATAGATSATNCLPGSFSASPGSTSCTQAPPGTYVASVGSTGAINCLPGSFSASPGSTGCTLAPAGSHVSSAGQASASLCAAGSFSASTGTVNCTLAPLNTYVATTGAVAATACPAGTFTAATGSTSLAACVVVAVTSPGAQSSYVFAPIAPLANSQSNGVPAVSWSATGLPAGLSVDTSTGTITGTPTTPCTCSVTLTATDARGHTGSTTFTWTVLPFSITTTSLPGGTRGVSYGPVTLHAAGAGVSVAPHVTTIKWLGAELPKGLKLTSAGVLSGTPNAKVLPGSYLVHVTATEFVHTRSGTTWVTTRTTVGSILSLTIS